MEDNNIQKQLEYVKKSIEVESARIEQVVEKMNNLNNEINELTKWYQDKVSKLRNHYEAMENSIIEGKKYIEKQQQFINENS